MRSVNNAIRSTSQNHQKHRKLKVPLKLNNHMTLAPINRLIQIRDYSKQSMNKYKLGKMIGSGSNAQVYLGMNMETGEVVACKKVLFKFKDQQKVDAELRFLQILQHKNIIKYLSHETTKDCLLIYQEYIAMGSLSQLLNDFGPVTEKTIKKYALQILDGLEYLHKKGILHLDLKSSNILLDIDGQIKITDFGCSRQRQENLQQSVLQGSVPWMAPEMARQEQIGTAADVWSFGCVILEMLSGKTPWSEQLNFDNAATTLLKIAFCEEQPQIPKQTSIELRNFLEMCFSLDSNQRATIYQLRQSSFLQQQQQQ